MSDEYDEAEGSDISDETESDEILDESSAEDKGGKDEVTYGEAGYKHEQQTASGFGESYEKFDAIGKALSEFNAVMNELSCNRMINLELLRKHIKENIPRLATLSMKLLALAVCYDVEYKTITGDSVTKFIKVRCKGIEPIDMIRYIKFYHDHRMTA